MSLSPSLVLCLAAELPTGQWSNPVRQFWEQALLATGTLTPTPGLLRSLQRDFAQGRWEAVTLATMTRLATTATSSVLATVRQEFACGAFGPVTRRVLESL